MAFLPSWYGLLCSLIVVNVLFETGVSGSSNRSNPLEADDILKKHTFGNHHQCQRLCWYIGLCERFSFYTKNLDDAHPHNCVLHAGKEKDDDLLDGWMQEKASGDYLPSEHGCRNRTCGKEKVCIPLAMPDVKNVCNDLPADVNECASSPCQNGTCVDGDRAYTCNCSAGYNGSNCETEIDECASSPCQNGGSCVDQVNLYTCNCSAGYNGIHCETEIDECASSPCQNGGSCVDQVNLYTCNCSAGYNGIHCETEIDECASSPCQNGGSCVDQVNLYTCNCSAGYNGIHCETEIDECASSPCQNGGSCVDKVNLYTCNCSAGYNGIHCETEIDECASSPCQNGGSCVDQVNLYTCNCSAGYTGSHCETDIDECVSSPCQNGSCVDQVNAYTCNCRAGYTGSHCETYINECASSPCQNGGSCVDQVNNYTCNCPAGYNGSNCDTDIDECASSPCQNGSCVDQVNAYTCNCFAGYNGSHCETEKSCPAGYSGSNCEKDVDECASDPCQGGWSCRDQVNGYACYCPPAYFVENCKETWLNETCTRDSDCTNHPNRKCYSGQCLCADGFFFSRSNKSCVKECTSTSSNTYVQYKNQDLRNHNDLSRKNTSATACAPFCNERPHCLVFVVSDNQNACWLKNITAQDYPDDWSRSDNVSSYQKTCP